MKDSFIRMDLENIDLERKVRTKEIRSLDDITLVVKALTDNFYDSKRMLYFREIKKRSKSNNLNDINDFISKTLDSVMFDENYYGYGLKLQKKRIPEV